MERYRSELDRLAVDEAGKAALVQWLAEREPAPRREPRVLRPALLAAAVAALLATTALAVGLLGGWEAFFGQVPARVAAPVGVSAASGDYAITLEETIVDQDGAAFLLSLRRADGGALEGRPEPYGMRLEMADEDAGLYFSHQTPIYSADGKTAYYCFQFSHSSAEVDALAGCRLALSYQGVVDSAWPEVHRADRLETVSLAPLAPLVQETRTGFPIHADMLDADFAAAMDRLDAALAPGAVPLAKGGGAVYSLAGGVLAGDGRTLALALCQPDAPYREGAYLTYAAGVTALTDVRTGERLDVEHAPWGRGDHSVDLFALAHPLAPEDLPYLEAQVEYDTVKLLSDQPFALTFPVENAGCLREVTLDRELNVPWGRGLLYRLHATGIRVSALKVSVLFDRLERAKAAPMEEPEIQLFRGDGAPIPLRAEVLPNEKTGVMTFFPADRSTLIDPADVTALQLGDTRIDLP